MLFFVFHHLLGKGFCDPLLLLTFPSCPFKRVHVAKGPTNNSNAQHIPAKSCVKINFLPHCNFRGGPYIYWRIGAYLTRCFFLKNTRWQKTHRSCRKLFFSCNALLIVQQIWCVQICTRQKNTNLAKHLFLIIVSCSCKCWGFAPSFLSAECKHSAILSERERGSIPSIARGDHKIWFPKIIFPK